MNMLSFLRIATNWQGRGLEWSTALNYFCFNVILFNRFFCCLLKPWSLLTSIYQYTTLLHTSFFIYFFFNGFRVRRICIRKFFQNIIGYCCKNSYWCCRLITNTSEDMKFQSSILLKWMSSAISGGWRHSFYFRSTWWHMLFRNQMLLWVFLSTYWTLFFTVAAGWLKCSANVFQQFALMLLFSIAVMIGHTKLGIP